MTIIASRTRTPSWICLFSFRDLERAHRFRTGHGGCDDMHFKWGWIDSTSSDCGETRQTMGYILNSCPLRRLEGQEKSFDSGVSLSLALWGRSEALLKLGSYSNAIVDVQQALKENLPGSYKAQAFWRMAKCYAALGEESRSKVSFDLTEKLLEGNQEKIEQLNADRLHYQHHSTVTQVITDKGINEAHHRNGAAMIIMMIADVLGGHGTRRRIILERNDANFESPCIVSGEPIQIENKKI
ncbi:hypothetical protein HUJ04_007007 [Dendroctonus ponderosae]|nr:hypothetical protein HUJ04_007007 [Dendroctonus ponderosae]